MRRTFSNLFPRAALGLGALALVSTGCGLRASSVPLGGKHVDEAALAPKREASAEPQSALPHVEAEPSPQPAEPAPAPAPPSATSAESSGKSEPGSAATAGAFEPRPFAAHQSWTRFFDLEFDIKVGPGGSIDMKMQSHQEARFEVLAATSGAIDKLQIEYVAYTSKLSVMGATQDSPEELAGKRFVVTFVHDKPEVKDASGATPPKKQADSVKDDAREPLETFKALTELARLAPLGKGDFSAAGAVALAGGEDEDTKVPRAKASLQKLVPGPGAEKSALIDLTYTLTNALEDKSEIEVEVAGSLSVLDAPARYQSSTLAGPMELRSADPSGMQGRGTIKVTTSYKY